jgi:D-arabinose 1-dehydrogenase-like Zn-dependent alcohol dehydrogenase
MLDIHSRFVIVGLPDEPLPGLNAMSLFGVGTFLGSLDMGSKKESIQMLQLVLDKGVKSWTTLLPMSDAKNAVEAVTLTRLPHEKCAGLPRAQTKSSKIDVIPLRSSRSS